MADIHDLENTVVAVVDSDATDKVADNLSAAGYGFEVLRGEEGKSHLDPTGESGPGATIKRLIDVFGDQHIVLDELTEALNAGQVVISVNSEPDEGDQAVRILQDAGGGSIWKLGSWTFARAGD